MKAERLVHFTCRCQTRARGGGGAPINHCCCCCCCCCCSCDYRYLFSCVWMRLLRVGRSSDSVLAAIRQAVGARAAEACCSGGLHRRPRCSGTRSCWQLLFSTKCVSVCVRVCVCVCVCVVWSRWRRLKRCPRTMRLTCPSSARCGARPFFPILRAP